MAPQSPSSHRQDSYLQALNLEQRKVVITPMMLRRVQHLKNKIEPSPLAILVETIATRASIEPELGVKVCVELEFRDTQIKTFNIFLQENE